MLIKPSTALAEDYAAVSRLARETGEPIYITQDGEDDAVLMNSETFEQMREQIAFDAVRETVAALGYVEGAPRCLDLGRMTDAEREAKILKGYADVQNGNVREARTVFADFRKRHGI